LLGNQIFFKVLPGRGDPGLIEALLSYASVEVAEEDEGRVALTWGPELRGSI